MKTVSQTTNAYKPTVKGKPRPMTSYRADRRNAAREQRRIERGWGRSFPGFGGTP